MTGKPGLFRVFDNTPRPLETLMWAGVGGALGAVSPVPGGALVGALVIISFAGLAGRKLHLPGFLHDIALFCVGIGAGGYITPEFVPELARSGLSLGLLPFILPLAGLLGAGFLMFHLRLDFVTALIAAVPLSTGAGRSFQAGHLSGSPGTNAVPANAAEARRIAGLRIFLLAAAAPVLALLPGAGQIEAVEPAPLSDWLFLVMAAGALGIGARLVRIPSAWFFGPFAASALLHATGILTTGHQGAGYDIAFAMIGGLAALEALRTLFAGEGRLYGETQLASGHSRQSMPADLRHLWLPAAFLALIAAGICVGLGLAASHWTGAAWPAAALALAPLAPEFAIAMSVSLGLSPGLVVLVHGAKILLAPSTIGLGRALLQGGSARLHPDRA